ncbi:phthiocerol/phthiodiolone dimycocerosyl transferase family protein [Streptomyces sp. Wb2n-11]|uniref:phthiocerol/phthiodiolone dimycocerosyl transferase family protein n=1 Tax=Streptomyces sp. Wb2n-11 TaxID=1030533 RepID=UPI000AF595BC|nr:non-ribosomal peptide synthetase [Streptomyces sp. Wb2n-11]
MSTAGAPRRLSDVEAAFAYSHALMAGTTQVTTRLSLRGAVPDAALERAVLRWEQDVPLLRLRIEERPDGLWFREAPGGQAGRLRCGPLPGARTPDDVLRAELNEILPTGGPLWRMRAVRAAGETHLFFTRNHAISDGHSTGAVLRALLDHLPDHPGSDSGHPDSDPDRGRASDPCPAPAGAGPFEDVHRLPPDVDGLEYRPPFAPAPAAPPKAADPAPVPFDAAAPWADRAADFTALELSARQTAELRTWCRAEGVTVNQFLGAAFAESWTRIAGRADIRLLTAISLRGRYPGPLPDVGCFISVVGVPVAPHADGTAETARRYGAELRDADARWRPPRRGHAEIRRAVARTADAAEAPGICITNIGVADPAFGVHAGRVTGFRTVVNRTGANYGLVLHAATFAGALSLALAHGTPATGSATARAVARDLHALLLRPGAPLGVSPPAEPVPAGRGSARRTPAAAAD